MSIEVPGGRREPRPPWSESWAHHVLDHAYHEVGDDGHTNGRGTHRILRRDPDTYPSGARPVILLHELPGITPGLVALSEELVDRGFSVLLPSIVGTPGDRPTGPRQARAALRVCLSSEFIKLRTGVRSPVTNWLRRVASSVGEVDGSVGVVGLCLTGGFALAVALEPRVKAAVIGQPSLPLAIGRNRARDCGVSSGDLHVLAERRDVHFLGLRYSHDRLAPCARFNRLAAVLGERFSRIELDSGPCNINATPWWAHAILTNPALAPGHEDVPGRGELELVRDQVAQFLEEHLTPQAAPGMS